MRLDICAHRLLNSKGIEKWGAVICFFKIRIIFRFHWKLRLDMDSI